MSSKIVQLIAEIKGKYFGDNHSVTFPASVTGKEVLNELIKQKIIPMYSVDQLDLLPSDHQRGYLQPINQDELIFNQGGENPNYLYAIYTYTQVCTISLEPVTEDRIEEEKERIEKEKAKKEEERRKNRELYVTWVESRMGDETKEIIPATMTGREMLKMWKEQWRITAPIEKYSIIRDVEFTRPMDLDTSLVDLGVKNGESFYVVQTKHWDFPNN